MLSYLKTLYHIIPKDSGESYLGINEDGSHVIVKKEGPINTSLVFLSEDEAQRYIDKKLDDSYMPERIGISEKHFDIKPTIVAD